MVSHVPRMLCVLLIGLAAVSGCAPASSSSSEGSAQPGFHGIPPSGTFPRPAFVLRDAAGNSFDFAQRTAGHPTFLYFGYTNCPDECPTAMADVAAALRASPPALRANSLVVFVTTDPERDTGPKLRRFLDQFSADFIGLTGTVDGVQAAQRAAGVRLAEKGEPIPTGATDPASHADKPGTAPHTHLDPLGYAVTHLNVILAYDSQDVLQTAYPGGMMPSDIAADLPALSAPPR